MAQVVLGGLGGIVGGGVGRIVGGALGRVVDNGLVGALGPAREGPRLEALRVQGTAEGAPMACVFGRARVTGQIVWAAPTCSSNDPCSRHRTWPASWPARWQPV